jgi:hypothetical protein
LCAAQQTLASAQVFDTRFVLSFPLWQKRNVFDHPNDVALGARQHLA